MNIAIIGPGALGCLLAGMLYRHGHNMTLFDHRPQRAEIIRREGIRLENNEERYPVDVTTREEDLERAELVLICVKAYNTASAVAPFVEHLNENARVLTLQNGIGNVEALGDVFGPERVWGGITAQGATSLGPGYVRHAGGGETVIGALKPQGEGERLRHVAALFQEAGLPTRVEEDVQSIIWSKLMVNVGINALTAITRLRNGGLLDHDGALSVMEMVVDEAVRVAEATGVKLVYSDPLKKVKEVAACTAQNISSMLQDVMAERRTEIDFINGAISRHGREMGVKTPVNETLAELVGTIENSYGQHV